MDRRSMGKGLRWARLPVVAALSLSGLALLSGFWPSTSLPAALGDDGDLAALGAPEGGVGVGGAAAEFLDTFRGHGEDGERGAVEAGVVTAGAFGVAAGIAAVEQQTRLRATLSATLRWPE